MIKLEYNYVDETEQNILPCLNTIVEAFQQKNLDISLGISENDPESVLKKITERGEPWRILSILYKIETLFMLNLIEFWLIDEHWNIYSDKHFREEADVSFKKEKYLYILIK